MEDLEIDFCGSVLRCHGVMTLIAVIGSKNVNIKNLTLEKPETMLMECRVVAEGNDYVDLLPLRGREQFAVRDGALVIQYTECIFPMLTHVEFDGETGEIVRGTGDNSLGISLKNAKVCEIDGNILRVFGVKRFPPIGNVIVINGSRRLGAGIFTEDSRDITLENIRVDSCLGMGLLAQTCENITLRSFNTQRKEGYYYTANADATHFVNCTGVVDVRDCLFEGQLDDALNVHGIYTRIVSVSDDCILVKEMHPQATGIKIYGVGDLVGIVDSESLIPYQKKRITAVKYVNSQIVRLEFAEGTEGIRVGDDVENLDRRCDLIFKNNVVRNNRARGMLIATKRALIENCRFHTSGTAIMFEASGDHWYESGTTEEIIIQNNEFDRCKHGTWGHAVIECCPRRKVEEGKYFHGSISVQGNRFLTEHTWLVRFDNVKNVSYQENIVLCEPSETPKITLSHVEGVYIDKTFENVENI